VFKDLNPKAGANDTWKMACSNHVYGSPDGLNWHSLAPTTPVHAEDDTKPTANWIPALGKLVACSLLPFEFVAFRRAPFYLVLVMLHFFLIV
jgi:hypothetical protein